MLRPAARLALAALLAGLAACGGGGAPGSHRTVTVTTVDTMWTGPDTSEQVVGPQPVAMEVILPDGATALPGTYRGGGRWTIPGVPVGPYTLHATFTYSGSLYIAASASGIDLGGDISAPVYNPAQEGTTAILTFRDLLPWEAAADRIQLYSYEAQFLDAFQTGLPGGATRGALEYDWTYTDHGIDYQNLLQAGDRLHALQMRQVPVGSAGDLAEIAVAAAVTTSPGMFDGTNYLAFDFVPVPATGQLRVRWSTSAFDQAVPGVHADPKYWLEVRAQPTPADARAAWPVTLLSLSAPAGGLLPDRDDGTIAYGQLAPEGWTEELQAGFTSTQVRFAPGATVGTTFWASVWVGAPAGAAPDPIAPAVSSVRGITVGGKDAMVAQSGVGTEPVVAWEAPAVGTPTSVSVYLYELSPAGAAGTSRRVVATFRGHASGFKVPAGLLEPGKTYVASLSTRSWPTDGPEPAAYGSARPWTSVMTITETFTP